MSWPMSQYAWTVAVLIDRATCPRAASMMSTTRAKSASSLTAIADLLPAAARLRGILFTARLYDIVVTATAKQVGPATATDRFGRPPVEAGTPSCALGDPTHAPEPSVRRPRPLRRRSRPRRPTLPSPTAGVQQGPP